MCMEQALLDTGQTTGGLGGDLQGSWDVAALEAALGLRSTLQGKLGKGQVLFSGLTPRVFLSILLLAKLLRQDLFPDDLFLPGRNVQWDVPGPAQPLRSVWTPPRKGRVTGVESLLMSSGDLICTAGWGKQSLRRMLRAQSQQSPGPHPQVLQVWGKSRPRAHLQCWGCRGRGPSVCCPTWVQWDWQRGALGRGDPEPGEGQRRG